jgi:hypothetical protein
MKKYTFQVKYSAEDKEFVGTCDEFPSISWLDANELNALSGIFALVLLTVKEISEGSKNEIDQID